MILKNKNGIMKAIWKNTIIAQSDDTIVIEGNHYFPRTSIVEEHFQGSNTHSVCPWKGTASYFSIKIEGEENKDAAWYYPEASKLAEKFEGYVAFWKGVVIEP